MSTLAQYFHNPHYKLFSFTPKGIPGPGSPCYKVKQLDPNKNVVITKTVNHHDKSVTLFIQEVGSLRFWYEDTPDTCPHARQSSSINGTICNDCGKTWPAD